jgi:serine/threonine protein phosphatase PrpC
MTDITVQRPITWNFRCLTDVGKVRKVNEDSVFGGAGSGLWAVADGMGGYAAGDVASAMVVSALERIEPRERLSELVDAVEDALVEVNGRIREYGEVMLEQGTVGSTVVSLLIKGRAGVCLWAGDSRLYRYRNRRLQQLSRDHSHVAELVQQGVLSPEEALGHPDASVITRAVGADETLYLDVTAFTVQVGDTFLLCSDGLYNAVDLQAAAGVFDGPDIDDIAGELLEGALGNGATDNVSLILIRGEPGSAPVAPVPADQPVDTLS